MWHLESQIYEAVKKTPLFCVLFQNILINRNDIAWENLSE